MAERPILPLEAQAAIEHERERILESAYGTYHLVFQRDIGITQRILQGSSVSQLRKPASLKLELKRYSSALFDAEARHYAKHARSDEEMRAWLSDLISPDRTEAYPQTPQPARLNSACRAESYANEEIRALLQYPTMLYFMGDQRDAITILRDPEHDRILDEQIAMGWGTTQQDQIPADWRTRRGPQWRRIQEAKAKITAKRV